jgi:3-phenylpropionate/trans-cinnamate dioxygenase ferredoxin subunit
MPQWVPVCDPDDIDPEDLIRFDHAGSSYAVYRAPDGRFYATAGRCTHEDVHLCDGLVMGHIIECPRHNGQFDYRTGAAKRAPACVDLRTYPAELRDGQVMILLP